MIIKELKKRPFTRLLFLWITGILLASYIPNVTKYTFVLLLPALCGILYFYVFPAFRTYASRWIWGAGFCFLFLWLAMLRTDDRRQLSEWPLSDLSYRVEGVVEDRPVAKQRTDYFPFRIMAVYNDGKPVVLHKQTRMYFEKGTIYPQLQPGDRLLLNGKFYPEDNVYLQRKGFAASAYVTRWKRLDNPGDISLAHRALIWKYKLADRYEQLRISPEERSVLSAITLGDTGAISKDVRHRFSVTGVSHLLSVSGFHVVAVCAFISLFFYFLPNGNVFSRLKCVVTLSLLWVFTAMTGFSASAVRAALMLSFFLIGGLFRHQTDSYNIMAVSAFCMLFYNPLYLFDVGFQLSYIAVFFILYLHPRINGIWAVRNPLLAKPWSLLSVTLAAQIGTAPLCLYVFGEVSSVFIFTNLPLAVLVTVLIPVALLWVCCMPFLPDESFFRVIPESLLHCVSDIVNRFGGLSHASFSCAFGFWDMLLLYAILLSFLLYTRSKNPRLFLFSLALLLIMLLLRLAERYYAT